MCYQHAPVCYTWLHVGCCIHTWPPVLCCPGQGRYRRWCNPKSSWWWKSPAGRRPGSGASCDPPTPWLCPWRTGWLRSQRWTHPPEPTHNNQIYHFYMEHNCLPITSWWSHVAFVCVHPWKAAFPFPSITTTDLFVKSGHVGVPHKRFGSLVEAVDPIALPNHYL